MYVTIYKLLTNINIFVIYILNIKYDFVVL